MKKIITLVSITLFTTFVNAQWSQDPTANTAISTSINDAQNIKSVTDGMDGTIIVWDEAGDIYAQKINRYGALLWTANGVAICSATGDQTFPSIISDGAGGAIFSWTDLRNGVEDIYAQRINSLGAIQWSTNGVLISDATGIQSNSIIETDQSGGAIITWEDNRNISTDIYAQRISSGGTILWTANGILVANYSINLLRPKLTTDGANGAIITWHVDFPFDIYAQRVNSLGVPQWTPNGIIICDATNSQFEPSIVSDDLLGAIIVWQDGRNNGAVDIYAQRVDASGAVLWATNGVVLCGATGNENDISIVSDRANGVIATWRDLRLGVLDNNIYAQRLSSLGTQLWTLNGVAITNAVDNQFRPTITNDFDNGAIITWYGDSYNVDAQHVNSLGVIQWSTTGAPICSNSAYQNSPVIVSNNNGGAVIVWGDARNGNEDVYIQNVCPNGSIGNVAPNNPSAISGNISVSNTSVNTYSVAPVLGAISYLWVLPNGWTGTSTAPYINATAGASGGTITVYAVGSCGNSDPTYLDITICTAPTIVGAITGNTTAYGNTVNTYTIDPVSGATSYTWTFPNDWTGTSTTNNIDVTTGITSGLISVTANDNCGPSIPVTVFVTIAAGVKENSNSISNTIYPNPSKGVFTVQTEKSITGSIEIFNVVGEKIYSKAIQNEKTEINLRNENTGIYFVKISNGETSVTKKIVIQ